MQLAAAVQIYVAAFAWRTGPGLGTAFPTPGIGDLRTFAFVLPQGYTVGSLEPFIGSCAPPYQNPLSGGNCLVPAVSLWAIC